MDRVLNAGQRLQGYTSGFFKVRQFQQRLAVTTMTNRFMRDLAGHKKLNDARLEDIGLTEPTIDRIQQYVDNGLVEFKDGHIDRLNMDQWDRAVAEDFSIAMNRFTHQVVQKSLAGETTGWMHRDFGALLTDLKTFPILAMRKQFLRNAQLRDSEAMMGLLYGLVTAGTVWSARQIINNRAEQLSDPVNVMNGAFGLSNMTGWIPLWVDPIAAMLGLDDLRFQNYGPRADVVSPLPTMTVMNRLLEVPSLLVPTEWNNDKLHALKAIPIIGNAYGLSALFNSWKE